MRPPSSGPLRRALNSFRPSSLPLMARPAYRRELMAAMFLPFLLAVVDSTIIGVVVRVAYEGMVGDTLLNFTVAILNASTAFANITSFIWVRFSHARDKVRFINGLQVSMIALVGAIALAPRTPSGLVVLTGLVLLARFCWAGFVTLRSTVWRMNYPGAVRPRVTGKLATIQVLTLSLLGVLLGRAMNEDPGAFRVFFPIGCGLSLVGVWAWSGVRVRRQRALLAAERADDSDQRPSLNPATMLRLLVHEDRLFGRFMLCMFLLGIGNLMVTAPLVIVVRERFDMAYMGGIAVANSIPLAMMPISIPIWARLLQRVHVIRFRAVHSWVFVLASTLLFLAVALESEVLLFASAVVQGLAFGGGVLAWNLGHLDFAPPERATQYMGVHVTLTGVRGLIAPFLGVGLYEAMTAVNPDYAAGVFAVCLGLSALGALGFLGLSRKIGAAAIRREGPVEALPPTKASV
ncbi:MAG: MFS transporter [Phycisphaeraceae bacterium]|nr:MFS transporter [Phycisphaeraceae bacterium]